jgi:hypothetical protein
MYHQLPRALGLHAATAKKKRNKGNKNNKKVEPLTNRLKGGSGDVS